MTPRYLQELAHALWSRGELAERLEREPLIAPPATWPDLSQLQEELVSLAATTVPEDDRLLQRILSTIALLDNLIASPLQREAILVAESFSLNPRLGTYGRAGNWKGAVPIAEAREATSRVIQTLLDTLSNLRSAALADLMPLVVRFVTEEARERGRDGALMFDDLILKVRNVLRDIPDAQVRFRNRYDALLIDEFQDTDPLQAEIALAFATDPSTGRPEPGRLFLVGDPKQSIYRFRRADMAMYAHTRGALLDAGSASVELSLNRRSQPGVIDWVNHVFQRVIGPGLVESVQPPYQDLAPQRQDALVGPAVAYFGSEVDESAAVTRQREARLVAAYCRDALRQGWQVYDRRAEAVRPARYGDIAVLLPARTILQPLERALADEGIPYRVEGGSLVYATQEVRDLINCLTAIDDPSDDVAVVAALRSPAYACSDVEIARLPPAAERQLQLSLARARQPGRPRPRGVTSAYAPGISDEATTPSPRWSRASSPTAAWSRSAYSTAATATPSAAHGSSSSRLAPSRPAARKACEPSSNGWSAAPATPSTTTRAPRLDDDEDAVRVLTIHAAKGLEFPIVFLAGLGAAPRNQPGILGLDRSDGRIAVQAGRVSIRFALGPVDEVLANERAHEAAERDRLLYVGATRARDHLIVSLFHKLGSRDTAAARLMEAGAAELADQLPPVAIVQRSTAAPFDGLSVDSADEEGFEARTRRTH